jgi:hypothetical protein
VVLQLRVRRLHPIALDLISIRPWPTAIQRRPGDEPGICGTTGNLIRSGFLKTSERRFYYG